MTSVRAAIVEKCHMKKAFIFILRPRSDFSVVKSLSLILKLPPDIHHFFEFAQLLQLNEGFTLSCLILGGEREIVYLFSLRRLSREV